MMNLWTVILPNPKTTVKTVLGLISLLLVTIVLPNQIVHAKLEISKITPEHSEVYLARGESMKFEAKAANAGWLQGRWVWEGGRLIPASDTWIEFSATGRPTLLRAGPRLFGALTNPRNEKLCVVGCDKFSHWVEYKWNSPGTYEVTAAFESDGESVEERWTVHVNSGIEIEKYPSVSDLEIDRGSLQNFRIKAKIQGADIAGIDFWAEGQQWDQAKDRSVCRGFFGFGCKEHEHARNYRWNQSGVYRVIATVGVKNTVEIYRREWFVKVGNRAPTRQNSIPPQELVVNGEVARIVLSNYFRDPDNNKREFDRLTYRASSNDRSVVDPSIAQEEFLTLTPLRGGTARVTVTASDGTLTETQQFTVKVNRPPVAHGTIPDQVLTLGSSAVTIDASDYFRDPDNDTLTYTPRSNDTSVADVSRHGSIITITPKQADTTIVTITASDGTLTETQQFIVRVNRPPVAHGTIPNQGLTSGGSAVTIDVSRFFNDPDNDTLTYTPRSNDTSVADVSRNGSIITITPQGSGIVTITVTASDGHSEATHIFNAVVQSPDPVEEPKPDLTVAQFTPSKTTLDPGENFDMTLAIKNIGKGQVYALVRTHLRQDFINVPSTLLDITNTEELAANTTETLERQGEAPAKPGTYYLTVCVEPLDSRINESDTTNNCSLPIKITVRDVHPNLVIESIRAEPSTVAPGDPFKLYTTIGNRGDGKSVYEKWLSYYQSDDPNISTADIPSSVIAPIDPLDVNETYEAITTLWAPHTPGPYYYGACIQESTNCSEGTKIIVTADPTTVQNRAPVAPNLILPPLNHINLTTDPHESSYDLSGKFSDPDNDPLTYTATPSNSNVQASMNGATLLISPQRAGGVHITVTASDGALEATRRITVLVQQQNQVLTLGGSAAIVDLSGLIRNPLTYDASSSNPNVAFVSRNGSFIIITPSRIGTTTITMTASNDTVSSTQDFTVTVGEPDPDSILIHPPDDDHGNTLAEATQLPLGSSRAGQIETAGDADYFSVQVNRAGVLEVYTTGNLDTYGTLQDSRSTLDTNDDGGSDFNFRIERAVSSGTYYIRVEELGSQTGGYTFHARFQGTTPPSLERITGPWLWMIAPTRGQGGAVATDIDSLAEVSGGAVTEAGVATNGANAGDTVGNLKWTLGKIADTGANNVGDLVNQIGLGSGDVNHHSSYALIVLESGSNQSGVTMRAGSDDSIKIWLNGRVVHRKAVNRWSNGFQDTFVVDLKQGDNLLLVKVSERTGGWSMFVGIEANVTVRTPSGKTIPPPPTVIEDVDSDSTVRHLHTLRGHTGSVSSVSFSPDGQTLASGGRDTAVRLWDVSTGRLLRTLTGHTSSVLSVSFSPDGQTLASGSEDGTVRLWDVSTGGLLHTLRGHTSSVLSVSFSPDGQTLASGGRDTAVRLWDVSTGRLLHTLTEHTGAVLSVSFSPDGQTLASGGGPIPIFGPADGQGVFIAIVAPPPDSTVRLWDVSTGRLLRTLTGHMSSVLSVSFSPDGQTLASGSEDDTVRLWDVSTGRPLRTLTKGMDNFVVSVSFSPDGQTLASGYSENIFDLWEVNTGRPLRTLTWDSSDRVFESLYSVSFSPDALMLADGNHDGTIGLWEFALFANIPVQPPTVIEDVNRSGVLFSDDFSSGNLDKWTPRARIGNRILGQTCQAMPWACNLEIENGALKLVATAGGNYSVDVIKDIFPTDNYTKYVLSFDWKSTVKETPWGISYVSANFYDGSDKLIGQMLALNTGFPNRTFEDHGGNLVPGRYGGVFKVHASFDWERVTLDTAIAVPRLNMADVHRIQLKAEVYNDAGSGGDLYVDNFVFQAIGNAAGAPAMVLTPKETVLFPNYPNPFNPETWIPYRLAAPAKVTLTIYAVNGQVVRTLELGHQAAGFYESRGRAAYWDGRNAYGEPVASGLYFYTLEVGDFTATRKMLIRK